MTHIHPFRLFVFLLLCCTRVITFAQSDSYQTIPESLRGYWQYKTENVSDWNGPLIGENFVEALYTVFQVEQMEKKTDGSYLFHLRNQNGNKMDFRFTPISEDSAIIFYQGWKEPKHCVRKQIPDHTEMLTPTTCLTSFTRNGWKDCPAMLYTNLHAMVNLYMTEKHGISYLPDISLIKSIVCSPKTENGTNCFTLAFLFPTQ